jgi:type VI secretion system secreted protein VgrG
MDAYNQEHRLLRIDSVLGKDHVLLVSLRGRDAISSCFSYGLELASTDASISPDKVLGTSATIWLNDAAGLSAPVNGIIAEFAMTQRGGRGLSMYRLRLVPSLWVLTRTSDCRIFQDKAVQQIVDQVLSDFGVSKKSWRLNGEHQKRDYCVQYRETAHDFICRLLEEEGIYFYFLHDDSSHTVVFSDNNRGLTKCANTKIVASPEVGAMGGIWEWENTYRFRTSQWALGDYNFETPSTSLTTNKRTVNTVLAKQKFEKFDYPGRYQAKGPGDTATKLRIEYEEAAYQEVAGEGACVGFDAGAYFTVVNAEGQDKGKEYLLTSVEHTAQDWSLISQDAKPATYTNRFTCAPRSVPYRPEAKTQCPRIHGTQTAVVTGPAGEEIFTDKYGRIKVQFFWDRQGKKDEHSSCFVRVAQSWAGRSFGTWFLPRIGQEVVVTFLEGDPDRPLVVGSVYNAEMTVPFALPANKTQSGLRTHSSMGGSAANCNEFRFEDKKGSEMVTLHAEKDLETQTEHDATHWVGHDETTTIDNNRTEMVHANETITIDKNRTETVHMNETVNVDLNRSHTVTLVDTLTVGAARVHTVGAAEAITVGAAQTITVGAVQATTVGASQSTEVADNRSVSVGKDQSISVGGNETISVEGNESVSVSKDRSTSIGQNETLQVGKNIAITAGDEIVLKTGSATITMKKNGDITIEGKQITIKGSGDVVIKGQKILQN